MKVEIPIAYLSNLALLEETERLADNARRATARLIAALAEVNARKLWADEGCSSLYAYCTRILQMSEQEAYLRIEAARVVQRFPIALAMLDAGDWTLTRHAVPDGDVAQVLDRALTSLLRGLERTKWAATTAPREPRELASTSRHTPASVKRAVRQRDDGRCAFVGWQGRCNATTFLEFHHIKPFALGGKSTIDNIELRCRAHNQREAELALARRYHVW